MAEVLEDGSYDAIVVDAAEADDGSARVELTIVAGTHKGEVVTVRGEGMGDRALDLLGVPATITVHHGTPHVRFEP
jgi:DnaJ-class molecular chaperone